MDTMKTPALLGLITAISLIQPLLASDQDQFAISWRGTIHYNDGTGRSLSKSYTDRDVVKTIADNNSLNPNDLILVYRPDAFDTAVVNKTTGAFVADYLQLPDITHVGTAWITDVTG